MARYCLGEKLDVFKLFKKIVSAFKKIFRKILFKKLFCLEEKTKKVCKNCTKKTFRQNESLN